MLTGVVSGHSASNGHNSAVKMGVPRWQTQRRSGLANLPSVGAVP